MSLRACSHCKSENPRAKIESHRLYQAAGGWGAQSVSTLACPSRLGTTIAA
jgi:hypothetical protein